MDELLRQASRLYGHVKLYDSITTAVGENRNAVLDKRAELIQQFIEERVVPAAAGMGYELLGFCDRLMRWPDYKKRCDGTNPDGDPFIVHNLLLRKPGSKLEFGVVLWTTNESKTSICVTPIKYEGSMQKYVVKDDATRTHEQSELDLSDPMRSLKNIIHKYEKEITC